jgi:hypothetical protein
MRIRGRLLTGMEPEVELKEDRARLIRRGKVAKTP